MQVVLPIAIIGLVVSWMLLRRLTRIWIRRPLTVSESIIAGVMAWLFLLSILAWLGGIGLACIDSFYSRKLTDIGILLFSILLTVYALKFFFQSRSEQGFEETVDFWKEAIQFRRSAQRGPDVHSLMRQEQDRRNKHAVTNSSSREHRILQADLDKEKEYEAQLALLRNGANIDISELWHVQTRTHSSQTLFNKVQEVRIDPNKKRLFLSINFPEMNEEILKDETSVLRLNRQVYDFFQSMNAEPWLKPYIAYIEKYFMICRATRKAPDGTEILYPFMKVEVLISELRELEGSYFNPRKLSEIAALTFNGGAQV